uniref:Amino_oxidase domain-containing protein n=1 Tax=Panagrellus redivivus TaxID=6233 RepID=A0A7E4ZVQ7_PANRE
MTCVQLFLLLLFSSYAASEEPKVAIIGAGIAGLSTANRFLEKGFTNFEIFEALDRAGGRIWPVKYEDGYLQHGAQFINGDKNPLYRLAEKLGVLGDVVHDFEHIDQGKFLYGDCKVDEKDISAFRRFVAPLDLNYHEVAFANDARSYDETVKSMFDRDFNAFLKRQNATTGHRRNVFNALTQPYRSYFEFEYAAKWEDLSLRAITEWDDLDGQLVSYNTDKLGYKAIIDYLRDQIPRENLHFGHRVKNIDYSGAKTVITLENGTTFGGFDFVIVTASLGHLKKYARTLFTPTLPKKKLEAIDKIGLGTSAKVFFEFGEQFWSDDVIIPLPVAGCSGRKAVDAVQQEFTTFHTIPWASNILMAWIAGPGPEIVDVIDDDHLSATVTNLFRSVYQNQSIPAPTKIIRNRWTQNDLFAGSYSYVSYAQAQAKIKHADLSIPVSRNRRPRIQFAGEATHHRIFQTAVGAFLTGRREADRVFDNINL